jgi:hypothetical protein
MTVYDMEYQYIYTHTNVYVVRYHKGKEVQRVHALSRAHVREV